MRGLLEKDIRLLMQRKSAIIMILGISLMLNFTSSEGFIVGYITMIMIIFSTSTLSYDEFDNGYAFIMTLPVSRKEYVREKYMLSFGMIVAGWFAAVVIDCLMRATVLKGTFYSAEDFLGMIGVLAIMPIGLDVLLPVQLKYGRETSRMVIFIIAGSVTVIAVLAGKLGFMSNTVRALDSLPMVPVLAIMIAVSVTARIVSYIISVKIWENKEF